MARHLAFIGSHPPLGGAPASFLRRIRHQRSDDWPVTTIEAGNSCKKARVTLATPASLSPCIIIGGVHGQKVTRGAHRRSDAPAGAPRLSAPEMTEGTPFWGPPDSPRSCWSDNYSHRHCRYYKQSLALLLIAACAPNDNVAESTLILPRSDI